jgi:hypothetical protein
LDEAVKNEEINNEEIDRHVEVIFVLFYSHSKKHKLQDY